MDPTEHHVSALSLGSPYDHIDIGWIEQRLNEQDGVRKSRLSAYFDGVMEFVEQPPPISRSPSPEPRDRSAWQASSRHSHIVRSSLDSTFRARSSGKGIPRMPSRRSTLESDSDTTIQVQQRRKIRELDRSIVLSTVLTQFIGQVTPNIIHNRSYSRSSRPLRRYIRPSRSTTTVSKIPNAHKMETRSKSRRIGRSSYSGVVKSRPQQRKTTR
jgi:hypothetical protein